LLSAPPRSLGCVETRLSLGHPSLLDVNATQIERRRDRVALWTQTLARQRHQPALLTVDMPARNRRHWAFVCVQTHLAPCHVLCYERLLRQTLQAGSVQCRTVCCSRDWSWPMYCPSSRNVAEECPTCLLSWTDLSCAQKSAFSPARQCDSRACSAAATSCS